MNKKVTIKFVDVTWRKRHRVYEDVIEILLEENMLQERVRIQIPCAYCMALISVPEEEYLACTHFSCRFCGKITNIIQVMLGTRWNWTFEDAQRLELRKKIPLEAP